MNALLLILRVELILCTIFGLWSHDWRLIFAGLFVFAITPLAVDHLDANRTNTNPGGSHDGRTERDR